MKKTLVASILGLATAVSVMAQSRIQLDTYGSSLAAPYPVITFGGNPIASGAGYTVGFYYSTTLAAFEPSGTAIPGAPFVLATGAGSTASFFPSFPGLFTTGTEFTIPGIVNTAYIVVVAYNGADYASSAIRGHSSVFSIAPNVTAFGPGTAMGSSAAGMQGFAVTAVPEPSTFALAGLGLASLLIFRRRK